MSALDESAIMSIFGLRERSLMALLDREKADSEWLRGRTQELVERMLGERIELFGKVDLKEATVEFKLDDVSFRFRVKTTGPAGKEEDEQLLETMHLSAWTRIDSLADLGAIFRAQDKATHGGIVLGSD